MNLQQFHSTYSNKMIAKTNLKKGQVYLIEILFTFCIYIASQELTYKNMFDEQGPVIIIARFTVYLLLIQNTEPFIQSIYHSIRTKNFVKLLKSSLKYKKLLILFVLSCVILRMLDDKMLRGDFLWCTISCLIIKYMEMDEKPNIISYGTGMACSFFEGYLIHIIPPDGTQDSSGFLGNMTLFEANNHVIFPVRKLFLIISMGLHCPTDLKGFNRENTYPFLEACKSLEDVQKDVAGVKRRIYRNSVYQVRRAPGLAPVYLAAECATPLHTLYKVKQHKALYEELIQADYDEIREDFCAMLQSILDKSPDCRGKCELIYYDRVQRQNTGSLLACIYMEAYLTHVIPTSGDPEGFDGIQGNIKKFEANNRITIPVKRLFLVLTKGLRCPTNLAEYNKDNRYPQLEVCTSLEKVIKNHAGIKRRTFRNTVYKVIAGGAGGAGGASPPPHLAAECISLLHSLYRVHQKSTYQDLLKGIDYNKIYKSFCSTLETVISRDPDYKDKCELIYYDPSDENQNLAEILLKRINKIQRS